MGDLDTYTFTANVGESYALRVVDSATGTLYPSITVYNPNGTFADNSRQIRQQSLGTGVT